MGISAWKLQGADAEVHDGRVAPDLVRSLSRRAYHGPRHGCCVQPAFEAVPGEVSRAVRGFLCSGTLLWDLSPQPVAPGRGTPELEHERGRRHVAPARPARNDAVVHGRYGREPEGTCRARELGPPVEPLHERRACHTSVPARMGPP